ncbi:hypothetical protein HNP38_001848 [Chryseobacterium defluvii]|uniref:Uncharacterized protein n=1 Tax=Chryseobacterium defluvii TaxID=160396 RepID=A0A840KI23_9FLAO|nr:hypothetical protein [Chryseobacterium defluvii]MBB4806552.1 hypothetical protein [Chryseobacterium defluvii]
MNVQAQIGIGTNNPDPSAALHVSEKSISDPAKNHGVLVPRMLTSERNLIASPAHGLVIWNRDNQCMEQNSGTDTSPVWNCVLSRQDKVLKHFYAPSIAIDLSVIANNQQVDLYQQYLNQFGSPSATSGGTIPVYAKTELDYYVLNYDSNLMSGLSLTDDGVLTYNVIGNSVTECSVINVLFVVK